MIADPSGLLQKLLDHQKHLTGAAAKLRHARRAGATADELATLEAELREVGRQLDSEVIAPIQSGLERN